MQIVYFCQSNPGGIVHTPHDCGVISRLQRCDDRGLAWRSRSMPAVLDSRDLTGGNNPADYRSCQLSWRECSPPPSEATPKGSSHLPPVCATLSQLDHFVALALQQNGKEAALRKGQA